MKLRILFILTAIFLLSQQPVSRAEERGYWGQLGYTFSRGIKNVISSPWEIPYTIRQHEQKDDGNPVLFRDTAGLFDGLLRTLTRFGSGTWDMVWAFVPGNQEGLPLEPETFFKRALI